MRMIKDLGPMDTGTGYRSTYALFFCEFCEREVVKPKGNGLKVQSCGCARRLINSAKQSTIAAHNRRLYRIWTGLKTRCENSHCEAYKNYGGRGISICEEWRSFEPFLKWALKNGYRSSLQIDRTDNGLGYSPQNCRWVTPAVNARNRRATKLSPADVTKIRLRINEEKATRVALAKEYGVCPATISHIATGRNWSSV